MRPTVPCLFLLLGVTAGCQDDVPPEQLFDTASNQLHRGDYADALANLQDIASDPDADAALRFRAARDAVECVAYVHGPERAKVSFQELWNEHQESLDLQTLAGIGGRLAEAKCPWAALDVLKVANEVIETDDERARLERLADHIRREANSPEMDAALQGLGYL